MAGLEAWRGLCNRRGLTLFGVWLGAGIFGGVSCGGDVSGELSEGAGGAGTERDSGSEVVDCTLLATEACESEPECAPVWRNDVLKPNTGLPPPESGLNDPCCVGCEQPECVDCHQPRFVRCEFRQPACKQSDTELCGYILDSDCD